MIRYQLSANEFVILKEESSVAHGGIMASFTDDLILTNQFLVWQKKGMFGNLKEIHKYPLENIRIFNGLPQVMKVKLSNGENAMEVYFDDGTFEKFRFMSSNRSKIRQWIKEFKKLLCADPSLIEEDSVDPDSFAGAVKEIGEQVKDVGSEFLGQLGFKMNKNENPNKVITNEKVSKKCIGCAAPLVGFKGAKVKCKYCDTEQVL